VPGRSGDLVFAVKAGWVAAVSALATSHGSANADDQRVPILLMGRGVKPGEYTQPASPADVAPTLAALSGLPMPDVEGRVLREALK
jgi:predicted AlkP superfamily pyrophosphatase or phosphodiesterase